MDNTINGKTPEEIKRGLECCKPVWVDDHWKTCDTKCPYIDDVGGFCRARLMADALILIQQLERERDAAVAETEPLNAEIDAINEDFLSGIHTVREPAQPKWISVEDELPKKWHEDGVIRTLVNYQIYSPRYGVDVGNYVKPAGRWVIMGLPVDDVTHWMPLPEPPKE